MKTPQVKPDWNYGIYVGNGAIAQKGYTIEQFVEFAKKEMFEIGQATEEEIDQVIEIMNDEGLAGDDIYTLWEEMQDPDNF